MTRDEQRNACIEAITEIERKMLARVADSVADITAHLLREPINAKSVDWLNGQESGWAQALRYAAKTIREIAEGVDGTAACDAIHGIAFVVPREATVEMMDAGLCYAQLVESWRAMAAAGDLTNPPEKKT